jgi:hypothetical protein
MIWKEYSGPAPKEPLLETSIHPDNHHPYKRPRPLTKRQRGHIENELNQAKVILDDADYFTTIEEIDDARIQGRQIQEQISQRKQLLIRNADPKEQATLNEAVTQALAQIEHLKSFITKKTTELEAHREIAHTYHKLAAILTADNEARLEQVSQADLEEEAHEFEAIIISTLTRLNFCHRARINGKDILDEVRFAEINAQPDKLYFKLAVSKRQPFGYQSLLPRGVRATDLVSESVTAELSIACQRRVWGEITAHNGAWLILNRLNSDSSLPNYLNFQKALDTYPQQDHLRLPIPIGVIAGNFIHWIYLDEHPHTLLGGSTGGGKSNIMNLIISTLIQKHSPQEANFVLIDLKEGLEFRTYQNIPHLMLPIITELDTVVHVMDQIESLRKQRMELLAEHRVRDINEYNANVTPDRRLPHLFVFFDEYASIHANKAQKAIIEQAVLQLLNKSRAANIHIILSTQHPSVNVIPGHLKTNFTLRIATRMPTRSASTTILGTGDAADLPATRGRAIIMLGSDKIELQTPHVTSEAIQKAIRQAHHWNTEPTEHMSLPAKQDQVIFKLTTDTIITIALNHFSGNLKKRDIWLHLAAAGGTYEPISELINKIVSNPSVEHDGITYLIRKQRGNFYRLVTETRTEKENLL